MITSLFRKSTPVNYTLVMLGVVVAYVLFLTDKPYTTGFMPVLAQQIVLLLVLLATLFIANFISSKNGLSKSAAYTLLFYGLWLLCFPDLFLRPNLIFSNFFILLAARRLVSLHSPKATKQKIFDASLWIGVATLYHFWSVLFILLVFVSIFFHVSRDYRNWLLPFVAFFSIGMMFLAYDFWRDADLLEHIIAQSKVDTSLGYFANQTQNAVFATYAVIVVYFLISFLVSLPGRPQQYQSSYKKIVAGFFIAVAIFVISPDKSNELLVYTFTPMAIIASSDVEFARSHFRREFSIALAVLAALVLYVVQL
jgi:hypothetical protein